jgi:co-chaperonin GroES (HSP10)
MDEQEQVQQPAVPENVPVSKLMPKPRRLYNVWPRHEWVLIRKLSLDNEITEGGIHLNKDQRKTLKGEVVAMGKKVSKDLKVGQEVLYSAFAMKQEDLEELTGDPGLIMVRDEEVYNTLELLSEEFIGAT